MCSKPIFSYRYMECSIKMPVSFSLQCFSLKLLSLFLLCNLNLSTFCCLVPPSCSLCRAAESFYISPCPAVVAAEGLE